MGMNFDDLYLGSFVGIRADGMTRNVVGMRPTKACYKRAEMVGSFLPFTFSLYVGPVSGAQGIEFRLNFLKTMGIRARLILFCCLCCCLVKPRHL